MQSLIQSGFRLERVNRYPPPPFTPLPLPLHLFLLPLSLPFSSLLICSFVLLHTIQHYLILFECSLIHFFGVNFVLFDSIFLFSFLSTFPSFLHFIVHSIFTLISHFIDHTLLQHKFIRVRLLRCVEEIGGKVPYMDLCQVNN